MDGSMNNLAIQKMRLASSLGGIPLLQKIARACFGQHLTIFTLHRPASDSHPFSGTHIEHLENCLKYLVSHDYTFLSFQEVLQGSRDGLKLPRKSVCFTLDDGHRDQGTQLLPLLTKYGCKPTFFLISDLIDGKDWPWDEKLNYLIQNATSQVSLSHEAETFQLNCSNEYHKRNSRHILLNFAKNLSADGIAVLTQSLALQLNLDIPALPPTGYEALNWNSVREWEQKGVDFAPHSCSHHIFSHLSSSAVAYEIEHSWARLAEELENPKKIFCYPTGRAQDFTAAHEAELSRQGFEGAASSISTPLKIDRIEPQRFRIPRISLPNTLDEFVRYVSWVEVARSYFYRQDKT